MKNFELQIASVPHREKVVCEVSLNREVIFEMSYDEGKIMLEIYGKEEGFWFIECDDFLKIVEKAKKHLLNEK